MNRAGIVVKPEPKAEEMADAFEKWLRSKKVAVVRQVSYPPGRSRADKGPACAPADLFCVFALGGDGTILSAVRWIGDRGIPILGVKFGEVGFLAETTEDNFFRMAESILENDFSTKPRMRLSVAVIREGTEIVRETVLNDVVINKGALARLARIRTCVNDHYLTTYAADGLIVATPTGSTAYSLAAGGPIIHPSVSSIILTPICPFTLTNRPLIIPDSSSITISLEKGSSDIMLTFDGQSGLEIDDRDVITIEMGRHPVNMITMPGQHYFDVLKAKLRWSGGRV